VTRTRNKEPDVPTALLEISDLRVDFAPERPAVNRIDVRVDRGEVVALVGESGSGKSMTARAVLGLLPPGARAEGSVRLDGEEILGAGESVMNRVRGARISLIFQEPQSALNPARRVSWQIREALRAHRRMPAAQARERVIELLRQVEMPEPEKRAGYFPHQLSGGQKQRVAIALALANDPEVLIADEPTTALDVTVQAEILSLLSRIRDRMGMAVLLITHDMGIVAQHADRVVVLNQGNVVEARETVPLFAEPRHAYTRQLLDAVPRVPQPAELAGQAPERPAAPVVLGYESVSIDYHGRRGTRPFRAVHDVSLDVRGGEVLGLVGESGSGKTTLGRAAAGLIRPTAGRVLIEGDDLAEIGRVRLRELRRDLAFVHQDPASALDPRLSAGTSIREPLDIHGVGTAAERAARVAELLDAVRLPAALADRLPHQLSGGQRQRVALARALALRPRLVIADEPTSSLDVSVQAGILALFTDLQRELGFACVFISHDLAVIHGVTDRIAVLQAGKLVESGPTAQVYARPASAYTRALIDAIPVPDPATSPARRAGATSA
jgi:peptide/nickel transport system ATP-binding protein